MATQDNCYPWWHETFAPLLSAPQVTVPSGCGSADPSTGNIPCQPEQMRASAEAFVRARGFAITLSLEEYAFARYMQSEVGSGTLEARVAVGEAGLNRVKRSGKSIMQLLAPSGYFGPIHGSDALCRTLPNPRTPGSNYTCPPAESGTCCAPFHRWAATSRDPTILNVLLAKLIVSGESGNFSRGADDQDGPEYYARGGQATLDNYVRKLAANGKFWVGPLPGVDHWLTFLQFTPNALVRAASGTMLMQRGLAALQLPRQRFVAPNLPTCAGSSAGGGVSGAEVVLTLLGLAAGAYGAMRFNRWLDVAHSV
jgi:hypothetical protein